MPFFSVIIPAYNRLELLRETLASVRAQTFTDYEVVVVDDGSTDGTTEWLEQQRGVRAFRQSNLGPGAARNFGASQARGKYLAFLDSDDVWFPWTLAVYRRVATSSDGPAFIAGAPLLFTQDIEVEGHADDLQVQEFADYLDSGDEWRWFGASSFVVRGATFRRCGGFRSVDANGEDADLALKLGDAPGFVQIVGPRTFGYRKHPGSLVSDQSRSIAGAWNNVQAEVAGQYPGGSVRARDRRRILTRDIRPVAVACLREKRESDGWSLYRATWQWHLDLRRWKFLFGFPALALMYGLRARS